MDYLTPSEAARALALTAAERSNSRPGYSFMRGVMGAAMLAFAVSLAAETSAQTKLPMAGTVVFPIGLAIILTTGFELFTISSGLATLAYANRSASLYQAVRAPTMIFLGNLMGSLLIAGLMYLGFRNMGQASGPGPAFGQRIVEVANVKVAYAHQGWAGLGAATIKALMCNFVLCAAVILAHQTRSFVGKLAAAWLSAMLFYGLGLEHGVINMFLIPAGMFFGAPISVREFVVGNLLPVTVGNALGGPLVLLPFYYLNRSGAAKAAAVTE